jgi:hypothetical protein
MPTRRLDVDSVRTIALTLPHVEEGTTYGVPAWRVNGRMFACVPSHRSAEPRSLVVRVDFATRDELLAAQPQTYYVTDHYVGYTSVLVRLATINADALRDLLQMAHRFMSASPTRARPASRKRRE